MSTITQPTTLAYLTPEGNGDLFGGFFKPTDSSLTRLIKWAIIIIIVILVLTLLFNLLSSKKSKKVQSRYLNMARFGF